MGSSPEPNRTPPPSSSQEPNFMNYTGNLSPLPQGYFLGSDLDQENSNSDVTQIQELDSVTPFGNIQDYDPYWTDSGFPHFQPGSMSDQKNQSLTSPNLTDPAVPFTGENRDSEGVLQFGSRIPNASHVPGLSQETFQHHHHGARRQLQFGTMPVREGSTSMMHNNTNDGATVNFSTLRSQVPHNFSTNSSVDQPPANSVQTVSSSPGVFGNGNLGMCSNSQEGTNDLARDSDTSSVFAVARETTSHLLSGHLESLSIIEVSSTPSRSINGLESPSGPTQVTHVEQQIVPYTRNISAPAENYRVELNQVNPGRRRQKNSKGDEDKKGCTCKKSKCLKLYCDCIQAKGFCSEFCSCKECENRPAYQEKVFDKRVKIESPNPLAFAPKVTTEGPTPPANTMEDGTPMTPASAWHRKGCNCKQTMCVKKYCECFQRNIGCSTNCWCERCQNSYGRRSETMYMKAAFMDKRSDGYVDSMSKIDSSSPGTGNNNWFPSGGNHQNIIHYASSLQPSPIPLPSSNMLGSQWHSASHLQLSPMSSPHSSCLPGGLNSTQFVEYEASLTYHGLVPGMTVGDQITPGETSRPSNTVQDSLPNQNHALLPPRFGVDGLNSVASSPPGSRPDHQLVSRNVPTDDHTDDTLSNGRGS